LVDNATVKNPKIYRLELIRLPVSGATGINLDMHLGLDLGLARVLAPSAPIILVKSLADELVD
jgi:hypothetical protein